MGISRRCDFASAVSFNGLVEVVYRVMCTPLTFSTRLSVSRENNDH